MTARTPEHRLLQVEAVVTPSGAYLDAETCRWLITELRAAMAARDEAVAEIQQYAGLLEDRIAEKEAAEQALVRARERIGTLEEAGKINLQALVLASAAFDRYAMHDPSCPKFDLSPKACTCGLESRRTALAAPEQKDE